MGERISRELHSEVVLRDVAISSEPVVAEPTEVRAFIHAALPLLEHVRGQSWLYGCVEMPQKSTKESEWVAELFRGLPVFDSLRITVNEGERRRAVVKVEPCAPKLEPADASDAGAPDGDADAHRGTR